MEEARSVLIASTIATANTYFKVSLYSEQIIKNCLRHPKHYNSEDLCQKLNNLLAKMNKKKTQNPMKHRHFWSNLIGMVKEAIDLLSGERAKGSRTSVVVPRSLKKSSSLGDIRQVLQISTLQSPVPLWFAVPEMYDEYVEKISEGSFGEIYKIRKYSGEERILKVIPVESENPQNREEQLTFKEIVAEIYASMYLSKLSHGTSNRCLNFPNIHRICVTQDTFPKTVVDAWRRFARNDLSEHPRPDLYPQDQAFITIETDDGGEELTSFRITSYLRAQSVFKQVATAVAVAEEVLKFEHRDLHVDNILVKFCWERMLEVKFRNKVYGIETHGVRAMIIDFTFSRMGAGDGIKYLALDNIFNVRRNCKKQFLDHTYVYGKMEETTRSNWKEYYPKTNILWMKHILETLLLIVKVPASRLSQREKCARLALRIYNRTCLNYDSASQLVRELIF